MSPSHPVGDEYQARFDALAAAGKDVHGEASFVGALDPRPVRVLDAGCGTGRVAIELARRGYEVVGTDRDQSMLDTAARLAPELPWIQADLATLELPDRFDCVLLAGNVLLFVDPGTQGEVLRRCAAHLNPGGAVVAGFSLDRYGMAAFDRDAEAAGLAVAHRWATWDRRPWTLGGDYAVTVLR
ncbi:MAG: class I SAM-dependent methyltransferase [Acidimicrobiia bacterium]|nr:class I SAM-dependent methyltransferase [Acidimicrobiia bacterium]